MTWASHQDCCDLGMSCSSVSTNLLLGCKGVLNQDQTKVTSSFLLS